MLHHRFRLEKSTNPDSGYYRLLPAPKTFREHIIQFFGRIIRFPYNIYQTIIGRLLSYLIINPLFRKDEKNESLIMNQAKHPDPLFNSSDEMSVINITPKQNLLIRMVLNWHNFIVNHMTTAHIANSFFGKILNWFPTGSKFLDRYLDSIVKKVSKNKNHFQNEQIHFRGLEKLTPYQQNILYQKLTEHFEYDFRQNKNHLYFFRLQTTDNAVLDSVEIRPPFEVTKEIKNRHFIVTCMPRSNNYIDWLKNYAIYAKQTNATIIAYNYRGVGLSRGIITNQDSLYSDAYEQVQRLLALGADPKNIALFGECLGANIATYTAGTLQQEGYPVKLVNARSFRSVTSILKAYNKPKEDTTIWHPFTWFAWLRYAAVNFILNPIISSSGWSLDMEQKFMAIPPHDRDYIVVRSNRDSGGKRFADDIMVPHKNASTYSLVKEKIKELQAKKAKGEQLSTIEYEWLKDTPRNHKFHVSADLHNNAHKANGHTAHPRLLITTKVSESNPSMDARQYTINFFNKIWDSSNNTNHAPIHST